MAGSHLLLRVVSGLNVVLTALSDYGAATIWKENVLLRSLTYPLKEMKSETQSSTQSASSMLGVIKILLSCQKEREKTKEKNEIPAEHMKMNLVPCIVHR